MMSFEILFVNFSEIGTVTDGKLELKPKIKNGKTKIIREALKSELYVPEIIQVLSKISIFQFISLN